MVSEVLAAHLRENLREFHLSTWDNGEAGSSMRWARSLRPNWRGARMIYVGPEGLTAHLPT